MAADQSTQYIFLVDDEPIQSEMLKDHLSERFKYKFKSYDTGEGAIKDLGLNPHIVILDYHLNAHLPNAKNGVDILKQIRETNKNINVIMLSGQDRIEVAIESMKYGAKDYVIKGETSFSRMEQVINKINTLTEIKAENDQYKKTLRIIYGCYAALMGYALYRLMVDKFLVDHLKR